MQTVLARLMCIVAPFALTLALAQGGCAREAASDVLPGVRLGMSPRDVRERFDRGAEGAWQTKVGAGSGDDTVLEWSAAVPTTRATHARFEFHLGMLVAVRAHLRTTAFERERVELTAKTVALLSPGPASRGGTDVTMLARDCPTHHEEAESLASKARLP